jgi:hypothetical protein
LDVCLEPLSLAVIDGQTEVNLYMSHTNFEIRIGYIGAEMSVCGAICNTLSVAVIFRFLAFVIKRKETIEVRVSLKNGDMAVHMTRMKQKKKS